MNWFIFGFGVFQCGVGFVAGQLHEEARNVGRCPKPEWHDEDDGLQPATGALTVEMQRRWPNGLGTQR